MSSLRTITGNLVRKSMAYAGKVVRSHAEACAAIGFTVLSEPAQCSDRIAALSGSALIPNTQNLYHSGTGFCLGQHSPDFSFIQPCDSLETLERARQLVGGQWASVYANKGGAQIAGFIEIDAKITAPKRGDKVGLSIAYFDYYNGRGFARMGLFADVLACNNGMTHSESLVSFSAKHNSGIEARFEALKFKLFVNLQHQVEEMQGIVTKLDTAAISRSEVEAFAATLFPATDESNVSGKLTNIREAIVTGFSRGTGNVGQTRWDAFNAVTEYLDWSATYRGTSNGGVEFSAEENRFESLTSGRNAQVRSRALELLLN